ncbi:MAG: hypothetical protein P8N56_05515 [Schleiferiaceae bacterium]|nr:hypothetical protein [Schleiferiaceae bacterium]
MTRTIRNILITLGSAVVGVFLNGWLISISGSIVAPPEGADLTTEEGLRAAMDLMEPKHYLMPFLAHALGTLLSAALVSRFTTERQFTRAMLLGVLFLAGGISMVRMLPSPLWFNITDLGLAYLPMAYLGYALGRRV